MPELHEEVQRLPDKYRNPVVLCYLEGKTHEEAALLLRWPLGTVKGRLARAREMLRSRLTRRGVGMSEESVATALVGPPATAAPALLDATIRAATRFAAGDGGAGGLVSARAAALTQGVLRTMMLTKVKIVTVAFLALAMLAGVGIYAGWSQAAGPNEAPKAGARSDGKPAPSDKGKDDKDAIQGTWQITDIEFNGKGSERPTKNSSRRSRRPSGSSRPTRSSSARPSAKRAKTARPPTSWIRPKRPRESTSRRSTGRRKAKPRGGFTAWTATY